ncbi:hypothetical protein [Pontibacter sp. H249]|uniref:hypothetical protein n=1 Tax=Pontibacter sp. H249 TaxID=3133420 RepID=UPI0030BCF10D
MKNVYFLLLFLLLSPMLVAQQKEVLQNAVSFDESKREIINKGRSMLLDKFLDKDFTTVKVISDSLQRLEDKDYLALYPGERWLIMYWTEDYQRLLQDAKDFSDEEVGAIYRKVVPQRDMLFDKMLERTRSSAVLMASNIAQTKLPQEQKDFLEMHLFNTIAGDEYKLVPQDTLNHMATSFLQRYPVSPYANFTKQYVRYELKPAKWGFGFEFFSGVGIFSGELKDKFNTNVPIGVAFDVSYKNWVLYLRDYIGFNSTKEALPFKSGVWEKDERATVFLPEASIGYVLVDEQRIKLAPFAGIAGMDITPPTGVVEKNPDYEDLGLKFTTTYTLGANLDLKMGRSGKVRMVSQGPEESFWFVRLRYAFNSPQFYKKYDGFGGGMHYLTVGIGGFGRKLTRQL